MYCGFWGFFFLFSVLVASIAQDNRLWAIFEFAKIGNLAFKLVVISSFVPMDVDCEFGMKFKKCMGF